MTLREMTQSIAVRLSVLFALAAAVVLSGIGFYLHRTLESAMTMRQQAPLIAMATIVRSVMNDIPSLDRLHAHPESVEHLLIGHALMKLWIYAEDGRELFASSRHVLPMEEWTSIAAADVQQITTKLWRPAGRNVYRVAVARFSAVNPEPTSGFIVLALDVSESVGVLRLFQLSIVMAVPAAMLVVALLGVLVTRRELSPIARLAECARRISASHLHDPLQLADVPPELQSLVRAFNSMLLRLEDSFHRLSEFSADLAHELRTPLGSALGRTELMLSRERSADEYRAALEASMGELRRLSKLVSDMLFLAHADHGDAVLNYESVDLRAEAERLIEFFGVLSDERCIKLRVQGNATVLGDRAMLGRALSNIVSNAIRHSPDGERVDIELGRDAGDAVINVVDRGEGIRPEDAPRIFERFYRVDPSRTRDSGGVGLGLAIARSIVRLHGGDIAVRSVPGKSTVFSLAIPDREQAATKPTNAAVRERAAEAGISERPRLWSSSDAARRHSHSGVPTALKGESPRAREDNAAGFRSQECDVPESLA